MLSDYRWPAQATKSTRSEEKNVVNIRDPLWMYHIGKPCRQPGELSRRATRFKCPASSQWMLSCSDYCIHVYSYSINKLVPFTGFGTPLQVWALSLQSQPISWKTSSKTIKQSAVSELYALYIYSLYFWRINFFRFIWVMSLLQSCPKYKQRKTLKETVLI